VYAGLGVWSLVMAIRRRRSWGDAVRMLAWCHAVPVLFVVVWGLTYVRRMEYGGGSEASRWPVIREILAMTLGATLQAWGVAVAALLIVALLAWGMYCLWKQGSSAWVLALVTCVPIPLVTALVAAPGLLYPRYFFLCMSVFMVIASVGLAALWRFRPARVVVLGALGLFAASNWLHTADLLRDGRGRYSAAVRLMVENTPGGVVEVAMDHPYRIGTVLDYYGHFLPPGKRLVYVDERRLVAQGSEWLIRHDIRRGHQPAPLMEIAGRVYELRAKYPFNSLSGWNFYVYRQVPPERFR
jgi:hypothetical protein